MALRLQVHGVEPVLNRLDPGGRNVGPQLASKEVVSTLIAAAPLLDLRRVRVQLLTKEAQLVIERAVTEGIIGNRSAVGVAARCHLHFVNKLHVVARLMEHILFLGMLPRSLPRCGAPGGVLAIELVYDGAAVAVRNSLSRRAAVSRRASVACARHIWPGGFVGPVEAELSLGRGAGRGG